MILGEGSLFALLGLLGLYLFVRVARRESYLALQQSNFVHAVTHEFRSPLQSLRLAAESQLRRPDPEKTKAYSAGMLEDVDRLEGLVENMLTVGRLDADAFRSQTQPVDLSEHVATLCERLTAHSKLTTCDIAPDIRAEADASTLEPILRNLIENAHKYGDGSAIEIRLIADGAYALLTVADAGRGFTAADRRHLFERFWRAGDERVRTTRGAGLGLFLVQTLARAQGAQVDATSEGPGKGATFEVRWPLLMDGSSR
jgi:signal transduction histidine kinase